MHLPVDTPIGRLGLSICYDLRFSELSLWNRKKGAEILSFPSAFILNTGLAHWEPECKDELKRKQLIELSIIKGTYGCHKERTGNERNASAAHLPTSMDYLQSSQLTKLISMLMNRQGNRNGDAHNAAPSVPKFMYGLLNQMQPQLNPAFFADYYKNLQLISLADPNMISAILKQWFSGRLNN